MVVCKIYRCLYCFLYFLVRVDVLRFLSKQDGYRKNSIFFFFCNLLLYQTYYVYRLNICVSDFRGWTLNAISLKRLSRLGNAIISRGTYNFRSFICGGDFFPFLLCPFYFIYYRRRWYNLHFGFYDDRKNKKKKK